MPCSLLPEQESETGFLDGLLPQETDEKKNGTLRPSILTPAPGQLNALLAQVAGQARQLGIPVSRKILPEVELSTRAKKQLGCCVSGPQGFRIRLSEMVRLAGEQACREVLAHEVLHTCPGCLNHGPRWKSYAEQMNKAYGYSISRLSRTPESAVKAPVWRWRVVCTVCGRCYLRQKSSALVRRPQAYRCRCGGTLRVEPFTKEAL